MQIFVTGGIDENKVKEKIEWYFREININSNHDNFRDDTIEPVVKSLAEEIDSTQSHMVMYLAIDNVKTTKEYFIQEMAKDIFGNGFGSRLMEIREKYGYAYTIYCDHLFIEPESLLYVYIGLNKENIEKTKELVKLAHDRGLSVEAEVGSIGGTEDGITGKGEVADPKECALMTSLGIDFLAAGIGNIHGIYPANWEGLQLSALADINAATGNIPLVLHGGTGIPDDQIVAAVKNGVSKINVNTDCQLVFAEATIAYCAAGKADPTAANTAKGYDPRKLLKPGFEAIRAKVKEKMTLFGEVGKAN
jgi:fructose/tagatose bisphosphate aldolase